MNIKNLRLFTEVADKLSFATVAAEHNVNPSSISRVICQIEEDLGVRLFQRNTRRMNLTEYGEQFLHHAMLIIEEYDLAQEEAKKAATPSGLVKISTSVAFAEKIIIPLIPKYQEKYPDISLQIIATDQNIDLLSDRIDLAVRMAPRISGDLIVTKLFDTSYHVCATPEYLEKMGQPKTPEELSKHNCLLYSLPGFGNSWKFRKREENKQQENASDPHEQQIAVQGKFIISSAAIIAQAALNGSGPALLANWLVSDDIAAGRLVDMFPDYAATATNFDTSAWIVFPSRSYLPQKVRVTIDFLKEELHANKFSLNI